MNPLRLLIPLLLATTSVSEAALQQSLDTAPQIEQRTIEFLDADGATVYRIPHNKTLDAEGIQRAVWITEIYCRFAERAGTDADAAEKLKRMEARWIGLGKESTTVTDMVQAPARVASSPRATEGKFVIHGDFSKSLAGGNFVIFQPPAKGAAAGGTSMAGATMGAATMGAASSTPSDLVPGEIGRAALKDGRFTLEGEVDQIRPVYFYVLDAMTPDGHRMGAAKGQSFILEPASLSLTMNGNHKYMIAGGFFNDGVYGPWMQSAAFQDLQALIPLAFGSVQGETEDEEKARVRTGMAIQNALMDSETAGRREVALRHPDPLVRQLAIETAWLGGPWMLEGALGILGLDQENQWAQDFVAREETRRETRTSQGQAGQIGGRYLPFAAESLDGESLSLSATCKQNKYVLLEFWASWCGPCRSEIPHIKKAYKRYHELGFEVFAYTLDDKRSAWKKASDEEKLPWLNTGFGRTSDPVLLYAVTGVPANYLIDATTGNVIARNLRGDTLETRLQELLGDTSAQGN